jgi:hypothetical protein
MKTSLIFLIIQIICLQLIIGQNGWHEISNLKDATTIKVRRDRDDPYVSTKDQGALYFYVGQTVSQFKYKVDSGSWSSGIDDSDGIIGPIYENWTSTGMHHLEFKYYIVTGELVTGHSCDVFVIPAKTKRFEDNDGNTLDLWQGGDSALDRPMIVVEGFDARNSDYPLIYYAAAKNFFDEVRSRDADVLIFNFNDGGRDIRLNADALTYGVHYVNNIQTNNQKIVLCGLSMGGVVARYCLTENEDNGSPLPVSHFLSLDSPHQGARINREFQDYIKNNTDGNEELSSVAAKQMLIYNTYDSQNLSEQFYSELNTKGINGDGYPSHGGIVNIGVSFAPDAPHDHSGKWLDIKYRFGPVTGTWESFDLDNGDPELEAGSFLPPQTGLGYSYNTLDWNDVVDSHIFSPVVGIFALFYNFLGAEFHIIRYKNHEPTFIPYNSALDIVNGQSKFDAVVVSEDKNYHDRFPRGNDLLSGQNFAQRVADVIHLDDESIINVEFNNLIGNDIDAEGQIEVIDNNQVTHIVTSGQSLPLLANETHNARTLDQKRNNWDNGQVNYQHRNWNRDLYEYQLSHEFTGFEENGIQNAVFTELDPVEIASDASTVWFKDPWYADENGNQNAQFRSFNAPFAPGSAHDDGYGGIFLKEGYEAGNWYYPYYTIKSEEYSLGSYLGDEWAMQFSAWEMTNGDVIFDDIYSNETAVDFRASNSKVKANYEPLTRHLASDTDPLIRSNGDRVMVYGKETHSLDIPQNPGHPVYDGNRYFLAYRENGQLYLTSSRTAALWSVDTPVPNDHDTYDGLGENYTVEVVDFAISYANGTVEGTDGLYNRSAVSIAWIDKVTHDGNEYYGIYYSEKDIATNEWRPYVELKGIFDIQPGIPTGISLLTAMGNNSEAYAQSIVVMENNVDGVYLFDGIKSTGGDGQFETFFTSEPGRQVAVSSSKPSSISLIHFVFLDGDDITYTVYDLVKHSFRYRTVLNSLFPNSTDHQNPSIVYVSEGDDSDPQYSYIAWEATRGGYSEIVTAKVNSEGSGNIESGHVVSARYQRKNCTSPVLSYNQASHEFALTYESAGEVIQIANLDTFSPRQWYYKNYGEGYAPTAPRNHAPGIAFNRSESGFHRIVATQADPNIGIGTLAEVQRMDYRLSPAENGGQEGLISIDMVELKKGNEALPVDKKMKTQTVNFTSTDQVSSAVSVRFINVSKALNPDKVLLSLALETGTGKLPLSNFKVREVSADSENEIKDFIKASTVTNLPVSSGKIAVDLGVASEVEHYTVLMTEEDIDNILGKAHRIGDDTRFAELLPTHFMLEQNYPNPFNPYTNITYALPQATDVHLVLYDVGGRKIRTLVNKHQAAGFHHYMLNGTDLASGVYLYSIQTPGFRQTRKLVLLK